MDGEPRADEDLVAEALHQLGPPGVRTGVRRVDPRDGANLTDVEWAAIAAAVERRRHEFAQPPSPPPVPAQHFRADPRGREPVAGAAARRPRRSGHDAELLVAAASSAAAVPALGIDVEPADPREAEVAAIVLGPEDPDLDAHLAFTGLDRGSLDGRGRSLARAGLPRQANPWPAAHEARLPQWAGASGACSGV